MVLTDLHDGGNFICGFGKDYRIGWFCRNACGGMAMLHAHRLGGVKPVAKLLFQNIDRLLDRLLVKHVDGLGLCCMASDGQKTTKSRAHLQPAGSGYSNYWHRHVIGVALSSKSG